MNILVISLALIALAPGGSTHPVSAIAIACDTPLNDATAVATGYADRMGTWNLTVDATTADGAWHAHSVSNATAQQMTIEAQVDGRPGEPYGVLARLSFENETIAWASMLCP